MLRATTRCAAPIGYAADQREAQGVGAKRLGARSGGGSAGGAPARRAWWLSTTAVTLRDWRRQRCGPRGCRRWHCGPPAALERGAPVLVQVPAADIVLSVACARCRTIARCRHRMGAVCALRAGSPSARPAAVGASTPPAVPRCRGADAIRAVVIGARRTAGGIGPGVSASPSSPPRETCVSPRSRPARARGGHPGRRNPGP